MTKFPDDFVAGMTLLDIERSQDDALLPLRFAIELLREGTPLPPKLADYLASAFEAAVNARAGNARCSALLKGLHLKTNGPRKKLAKGQGWFELGLALDSLIEKGIPKEIAVERVSTKVGLKRSTILARYKEYLSARAATEKFEDEEREAERRAQELGGNV